MRIDRPVAGWLALGWLGLLALPWYAIEDGFWSFVWLEDFWSDDDHASALAQVLVHGRGWLAPIGLAMAAPLAVLTRRRTDPVYGAVLLASAVAGLAYVVAQGFAIGIRGWEFEALAGLLGELESRQFGMGYGALLACGAFLFLLAQGLAARGAGLRAGDVHNTGTCTAMLPAERGAAAVATFEGLGEVEVVLA